MSSNKLLLRFALKYPGLIFLSIALGFSGALFNGVGTALIVPLLLGFLGQNTVNLPGGPPILRRLFTYFSSSDGNTDLVWMVGAVFIAILLKNMAAYLNALVATSLSRKLVNTIRKEALTLLLSVDLDYFSKIKLGDVINRISQEIGRTANSIKIGIDIFTKSITILVFLGILLTISWQLTIVSTFLLLVVALFNQIFIKRAKTFGKILSQKSKGYSTALLEIMTGIRLIKSVNNEQAEYQRIAKIIDDREKADFQSQANFAIAAPINEITGIMAMLTIVFVGANFLQDTLVQDPLLSAVEKQQALSTLLLIYLYTLSRLLPIVGQFNGQRSRFANLSPSAEIVADFLRQDNKPLMVNGTKKYQNLQQEITLEDVYFKYPGNEDYVLQGVNLSIPKGTSLALVGSSGAGKSTLVDLIPRFYDPDQGKIKVDGQDLKEYDIASLRQAMGIVSQDTFLFNNTVGYNIAYGLENVREEAIIEATKRANAYDFITNLPQGFDTEIGDRGVMLSGGQRQRLAIARALLRNPDVLILDEATSALDTVSERLVQQAIDELCRDRTTIVIAHRLSTVQKADQIAVMEKGRVVEIGKHEQLLQKPEGHYARLYNLQFEQKPSTVTLPHNESMLRAALLVSYRLRNRLSYEIRNKLTTMLGSLGLLNDNLIDNINEQEELLQESYESAVSLLDMVESFEENTGKFVTKCK